MPKMGDRGKQQVKTKDIHTPKKRLKTSSKKKKKTNDTGSQRSMRKYEINSQVKPLEKKKTQLKWDCFKTDLYKP